MLYENHPTGPPMNTTTSDEVQKAFRCRSFEYMIGPDPAITWYMKMSVIVMSGNRENWSRKHEPDHSRGGYSRWSGCRRDLRALRPFHSHHLRGNSTRLG